MAQLLYRGQHLVSVTDAARVLHADRKEAAKKLAHWAAKGWLRRVRRGLYVPVPLEAENPASWSEDALYIADAVWAPCYFSGWTAANHWSLTEQVFRTTVVKTAERVRSAHQRLLDHEYLVSHLSAEAIWGVTPIWRAGRRLQMADPARTVIDMLDTPSVGGGIRHVSEVLAHYLEEHDARQLVVYGDRLGNRSVFKRLGYLAAALGSNQQNLVAACRERLSAGVVQLEPGGPRDGKLAPTWGLRVNVHVARGEPS